jgi:hypothetical protein
MFLKTSIFGDDPLICDQARDRAFTPPTICHGAEICRISITIQEPSLAVALPPIVFFHFRDVDELAFIAPFPKLFGFLLQLNLGMMLLILQFTL